VSPRAVGMEGPNDAVRNSMQGETTALSTVQSNSNFFHQKTSSKSNSCQELPRAHELPTQ
jgi:hypothetical protein